MGQSVKAIIITLFACALFIQTISNTRVFRTNTHYSLRRSFALEKSQLLDDARSELEQVKYAPYPSCESVDGVEFEGTSPDATWTLLCDTDIVARDIYPFLLTKSFDECQQACEFQRSDDSKESCVAFIFAPSRQEFQNDCYLKSDANKTIHPAGVHLLGAVIKHSSDTASSDRVPSVASVLYGESSLATGTTVAGPTNTDISFREAGNGGEESNRRAPIVSRTVYLGVSVDEVAKQYVSYIPAKPQQLSGTSFDANIDVNLIKEYDIASDTGTWTLTNVGDHRLAEMKDAPRLSRDGGRGRNINGTNVFIFCDTATYGREKDPILGYLNGFVSSSVAVDNSMQALEEKALLLTNSLGQWQDDVGRMRGWIPMTEGEEAFNTAVSGRDLRYAAWPNSSPIPLNGTLAIMYVPLVYLRVDMQDQSHAGYTNLGNTLITISIDEMYGPHAERLQKQFFSQDEINWGSLGGIRAWSGDSQDNRRGTLYLLGQVDQGIMLAKVAVQDFADRSRYMYWTGASWSDQMPPSNSSNDALLIHQPVMSVDVIYSQAFKTFLMIYLTPDADNTFYYRYLQAHNNSALTNVPSYETGGHDDYVEEILSNKWSDQKVLFQVPVPERGYIYAGGIHAGYFGEDDIEHGGTKMLCTWAEHTKLRLEQPNSGYAHKSQIVELSLS